mmetsp:Transcript_69879/g.160684  ORF Transcript_69879/g.160684 Transcript_69879/m.160684 type:complete len:632 (+) Transcript_69879:91-1986(+)
MNTVTRSVEQVPTARWSFRRPRAKSDTAARSPAPRQVRWALTKRFFEGLYKWKASTKVVAIPPQPADTAKREAKELGSPLSSRASGSPKSNRRVDSGAGSRRRAQSVFSPGAVNKGIVPAPVAADDDKSSSSSSSSSAENEIRVKDHVRVAKSAPAHLNPGKHGEAQSLHGDVVWVCFAHTSAAVPLKLLTACRGRKKPELHPPRARGESWDWQRSRRSTLCVAEGVSYIPPHPDDDVQDAPAAKEVEQVATIRRRGSVSLSIGMEEKLKLEQDAAAATQNTKEFSTFVKEYKRQSAAKQACISETELVEENQIRGLLALSTSDFQERNTEGAVPSGAWKVTWSCGAGSKGDGSNKCPNQDAFSMTKTKTGELVVVVADGHGDDGHHVACRVVRSIPVLLENQTLLGGEAGGSSERFSTGWFKSAFRRCEVDVEAAATVEGWTLQASGATCAVAVLIPSPDKESWGKLYMAHLGDSRITLVSERCEVLAASVDHSLDDEQERQRIVSAGGEVREVNGHRRVFRAGKSFPGLGMARSFGDVSVKDCGVTELCTVVGPVPVPQGARVMVASDGVWDKLDEAQVLKENRGEDGSLANATASVAGVVAKAREAWQSTENGYCDDVTLVVCDLPAN